MAAVRAFALAAAAIAAASVAFPGTAAATPPRDTDGTVLWQMTDDGKDYVFREITIAPGGSTGWHSHDGQLFGVVKEGVLMHNRADCTMDGLYVAGQSIAEKSGPELRAHRPQRRPGPAGSADSLHRSRRGAAVGRCARSGLRVCLMPETVIRRSIGSEY